MTRLGESSPGADLGRWAGGGGAKERSGDRRQREGGVRRPAAKRRGPATGGGAKEGSGDRRRLGHLRRRERLGWDKRATARDGGRSVRTFLCSGN